MSSAFVRTDPLGRSTNQITAAVISDLHVYDKSLTSSGVVVPSFIELGTPEDQVGEHPIKALLTLIECEGISADILLCPVDLGDKSQPAATKHAWTNIHEIEAGLGMRAVFATAGNHDVDSRFT